MGPIDAKQTDSERAGPSRTRLGGLVPDQCSPARWGTLDVSLRFPLGPLPPSSDLLAPLGPWGSTLQASLSVGFFSGALSPGVPL